MAKKTPYIPTDLAAFIKRDETTFHCNDGDWDLQIQSRDDSDFKDELPPGATMIAENGCGDCLFLKMTAAGTVDPKVYVYWHEEERSEVFVKSREALIAASDKNKKGAANKSPTAKAPANTMSVKELEAMLKKKKDHERWAVMREFHKSDYGLEVLPLLRRLLAEDDASMVIHAAECIAKLGPEAGTCPAGQASEIVADGLSWKSDLCRQLKLRGAQVWSYSGVANCYPACLDALVKLKYEPDYLIDFVRAHVGIDSDFFLDSLVALKSVGTPEARALAERGLAFWLPDMNMSETKKAKALVESMGAKKKK